MMHTMNSTGLDIGFTALWGIHMLAVFAFIIGIALFIGWAIKTLSPARLKNLALWLLLGGAVVCLLTIAAKGSPWSQQRDGMNMNMHSMHQMMMEEDDSDMDHMMMDGDDAMSMSMDDMSGMLEGKTGDAFDKAFIEGMIPHHQGAIDMARAALASAKHAEIKNMANAIISAQQSEIDMMKQWQKDWGYTK